VTLVVHRAAHTGSLADELAGLLAQPLADPFAEEVVVVPARGVERWLSQRLSHRLGVGTRGGDGVCAGVRFLSPHSLVALLLGREHDDPWQPDRLAWTVLQAVDDSLGEPWCHTLATHLGHGLTGEEGEVRQGRRWSVARRLAGLFSAYAVQRPALVTDWREGRDTDGLGGPLEPDLCWQAELWRRVLARVDAPPPDVRLEETVTRLEAGDEGLDLPGRLSLFGHTRMPVTEVRLLEALGRQREVHLWLPQASPALWDELAPVVAPGPVPRAQDRSVDRVRHPLLAALGRDAREVQRVLATATSAVTPPAPDADGAAPPDRDVAALARAGGRAGGQGGTLLGWLQDDIRHNRAPDAATVASRVVPPTDRSVQVHACHGPARQVEVLREVLSGLLQDDPGLEPRDILVMCPDIDDYAPLVHAGFGLADVVRDEAAGHPAHRLRVRLADRGPRHTNPLLSVAADLVRLAGGRVTASEVLDLARSVAVRRRFGLDEDELERVGDWVREAVIRWGLDHDHRGLYQLRRFGQNTWRFGLDRILTGVVVDGTQVSGLGTALALDDLDSGDIDLAGRLAELLDRLGSTLVRLRACHAAPEWAEALRTGVLSLADVAPRDAWQVTQLERELERIRDASVASADPLGSAADDALDNTPDTTGRSTGLSLSDVSAVLQDRLGGRPTRANFRTGTLTVCTMVPMRSVPHRVVCLVGLDDGLFPRTTTVDGDDVLARTPVTGERDPRSEDRQLLLDAVMAAQETLVVTYTGADEHTGAARPPSVPLGELVDAARAGATFPGADGPDADPEDGDRPDPLVVRHPLQPFDPRNLTPGALFAGERPFSFDGTALEGARAGAGPRHSPAVVGDHPLPARPGPTVSLTDLRRFYANPARAFLSQRLGVLLPEVQAEASDGIPIELDGLEQWAVGDRVLRDVLSGRSLQACREAELLRGQLPPGTLGQRILDEVCGAVEVLAAAATALRAGEAHAVDVDVDLGGGRRLVGTVPHLHGDRAVVANYSQVRARHRIDAWITLLALTATDPSRPWTSHVVGRRKAGTRAIQVGVRYGPVGAEEALQRLRELVDVHDRGLREPLPLPVETAHAYAEARLARSGDPVYKARSAWQTEERDGAFPREDQDPAFVRLHGRALRLAELLGTPRDDERWDDSEQTRLGQLALRVWQPVLTGPEETVTL
jgi:exodeoxyribonuclease V gamma subunit